MAKEHFIDDDNDDDDGSGLQFLSIYLVLGIELRTTYIGYLFFT